MGDFRIIAGSGLLAVTVYASLLSVLLYRYVILTFDPIEYAPQTKTVFEISIEEPEPEEKPKKPPPVVPPKKEEPKPVEQKEQTASKTPKVGKGVKDLFQEVETKVPVKKEDRFERDLHDALQAKIKAFEPSQKKKPDESAQKIIEQVQISQTLSVVPVKGYNDEYYAKIYDLLSRSWRPSNEGGGSQAKVRISVDRTGRFSYTVLQPSDSSKFNEELHLFLQKMMSTEFPPFEGEGKNTTIEVTFKTEV